MKKQRKKGKGRVVDCKRICKRANMELLGLLLYYCLLSLAKGQASTMLSL